MGKGACMGNIKIIFLSLIVILVTLWFVERSTRYNPWDDVKYWQKAVASSPYNVHHHLYLGSAYFEHALYTNAEVEYKYVLYLKPDYYSASIKLSELYLKLGQKEKARELLKGVIDHHPGKILPSVLQKANTMLRNLD